MAASVTISYQKEDNDICIVSLSGDIDESNQAELEAVFQKILDDDTAENIIFKVSALDYVNSGVIGLFANYHSTLREKGRSCVFAQPNESIFSIFDLVGLTEVIESFSSLEEARLSFE
jgi:anti-anti-sigma factor